MSAHRIFPLNILSILILLCASCSQQIKVSEQVPPTFYTSGDTRITVFEVSGPSGLLWKILPAGTNRVTLSEVKSISYGVVPASWKQIFPQNMAPAPLIEGSRYEALAVVLSSDVVRVQFTIKEGKAIELPKEH